MGAPRDGELRRRAVQLLGDADELAHLVLHLVVGDPVLDPLVALERRTGALGDAVEVLAGEEPGGERGPDGEAEPDVLVEPGVLLLDLAPGQQVVLRLLHDRLVQVVALGDLVGGADLVRRPLRRAPVVRPAAVDGVGHRPHRLLDGRVRVGAVAEDEVVAVEADALERGRDRLEQVLAVQGQAAVRAVVDPPVELRRHDVLVALPPVLADGLAHEALRLPAGVGLGVVEEVHAGVERGAHAVGGEAGVELRAEGHPAAERQHADLEPGSSEAAVLHVHGSHPTSGSGRPHRDERW